MNRIRSYAEASDDLATGPGWDGRRPGTFPLQLAGMRRRVPGIPVLGDRPASRVGRESAAASRSRSSKSPTPRVSRLNASWLRRRGLPDPSGRADEDSSAGRASPLPDGLVAIVERTPDVPDDPDELIRAMAFCKLTEVAPWMRRFPARRLSIEDLRRQPLRSRASRMSVRPVWKWPRWVRQRTSGNSRARRRPQVTS